MKTIKDLWEEAEAIHRESVWSMLPEHVIEQMSVQNVSNEDLDFLLYIARKGISSRSIVAIRLLGNLVEENLIKVETVQEILKELLQHNNPGIRIAAIEVIWQIRDISMVDNLKMILEKENNELARRTLEHVIGVLCNQ